MELSLFEKAGAHTGGKLAIGAALWQTAKKKKKKQAQRRRFGGNISYRVEPFVPAALGVALSAI